MCVHASLISRLSFQTHSLHTSKRSCHLDDGGVRSCLFGEGDAELALLRVERLASLAEHLVGAHRKTIGLQLSSTAGLAFGSVRGRQMGAG